MNYKTWNGNVSGYSLLIIIIKQLINKLIRNAYCLYLIAMTKILNPQKIPNKGKKKHEPWGKLESTKV